MHGIQNYKSFFFLLLIGIFCKFSSQCQEVSQRNSFANHAIHVSFANSRAVLSQSLQSVSQEDFVSWNAFSLGAGSSSSISYSRIYDSSWFRFELGAEVFQGNYTSVFSERDSSNPDLMQSFSNLKANKYSLFMLLGMHTQLAASLYVDMSMGVSMPLFAPMTQYHSNQTEEAIWTYRLNRMPAYLIRAQLGYRISPQLSFDIGASFTLQYLSERHATLTSYTENGKDMKPEERFPDRYDREREYVARLADISNDPAINPTAFDRNKPSQALRNTLPFNSIGVHFTTSWWF